jgi:hypothetical protein
LQAVQSGPVLVFFPVWQLDLETLTYIHAVNGDGKQTNTGKALGTRGVA